MKIHQGDVMLIEVKKIPKTAKFIEKDIIQRGKVTGHAHRVEGCNVFFDNESKKKYVDIPVANPMTHEDHPSVKTKVKKFLIQIQKEFFPSEKNGEEGYYEEVPD